MTLKARLRALRRRAEAQAEQTMYTWPSPG